MPYTELTTTALFTLWAYYCYNSGKMRKLLLLMGILLWAIPYSSLPERGKDRVEATATPPPVRQERFEKAAESEDDIISFSYDQEMLSRKFLQKKLEPLAKKDTVIWAFKTAHHSVLL